MEASLESATARLIHAYLDAMEAEDIGRQLAGDGKTPSLDAEAAVNEVHRAIAAAHPHAATTTVTDLTPGVSVPRRDVADIIRQALDNALKFTEWLPTHRGTITNDIKTRCRGTASMCSDALAALETLNAPERTTP